MPSKYFKPGSLVTVTHNSYGFNHTNGSTVGSFNLGEILTVSSENCSTENGSKYAYNCENSKGEFRYLSLDCEADLVESSLEKELYEIPKIIEKVVESSKENMGIRLNNGKLRWRNFPMFLMEPVIRVGSFAEKREGNPNGKYETFNFLKGMQVNDCMDSLKRHLMRFESPYESDNDEESTESHLAHIAWNALVALHMLKTRPELDDRYKLPETKKEVALSEEEKYEAAEAIQTRGR